jgi:hypothetical protein
MQLRRRKGSGRVETFSLCPPFAPFLLVRTFLTSSRARGARRAPGWPPALGRRRARTTLTQVRRISRRSPGRPFGERCAPRRRLPLLALPGTAASAREPSPPPAGPAKRRNDRAGGASFKKRPSSPRTSLEPGKTTVKGARCARVARDGATRHPGQCSSPVHLGANRVDGQD